MSSRFLCAIKTNINKSYNLHQNKINLNSINSFQKSFDLNDFADTLKLLNKFIKIFPNFLPHMFNVYRGNFRPSSNTVTFKPTVDEILGENKDIKGQRERSPIVIKSVLMSHSSPRETTLIRKIDHPNVLGCFGTKKAVNSTYIDFCECNLLDLITTSRYDYLSENTIKLLQQAAQGLDHLHSLNISMLKFFQ